MNDYVFIDTDLEQLNNTLLLINNRIEILILLGAFGLGLFVFNFFIKKG